MWNKSPPRGNEPLDPKRTAPDPHAPPDHDAEQTVRISTKPERSRAAMPPQAEGDADPSAGAESDAAPPPQLMR